MCETFCRVCVFIWTFGSRWFFFLIERGFGKNFWNCLDWNQLQ
jgi:hypothetical protein